MRTIAAVALLALLSACGAWPKKSVKLPPPTMPPLCVQFDTHDVLVNYPTTGPRQPFIEDLMARVDRELASYLAEAKLPSVPGPCQPDTDAVMTVRIERLEAVAERKFFVLEDPWATAIEARLKYHVTLQPPGAAPWHDRDGQYQYESLDALTSKLAHRLYDLAIVRYPKASRTGPVKRAS